MNASAHGAALDAVIATYPNLDADRLGAKLRSAVSYGETAAQAAHLAASRAREKQLKLRTLADGCATEVALADEAVDAAVAELATAEAALAQFEEVNS